MTAERPKALSIRKKGSSQFLRNLLSRWPILIWLGVAFFAWQLHRRGVEFQRINGIVYADTEAVAPLEDGILLTLEVHVGDKVTAGQTVAKMDDSLILTEIADYTSTYALERLERMQRFQTAFTDAEDQLAKVEADQKADTEQAAVLKARVDAMKKANAERPGTHLQPDIDKAELDYSSVNARLDSYRNRITNLTKSRDSAKAQLAELIELDKGADASSSAGLKVLEGRRAAKTLTAKRDGVVAKIYQKPGAVVPGGDPRFPVLTIVTGEGLRVRGFILEEDAARVKVGDPVSVIPTSDRENRHKGEVIALAPQVISKPDAASTVSNRMVTGREVEIRLLDEGANLIPGQSVVIEVTQPKKFDWWSLGFRRTE
jgi:multidrug resistance efflux pump